MSARTGGNQDGRLTKYAGEVSTSNDGRNIHARPVDALSLTVLSKGNTATLRQCPQQTPGASESAQQEKTQLTEGKEPSA